MNISVRKPCVKGVRACDEQDRSPQPFDGDVGTQAKPSTTGAIENAIIEKLKSEIPNFLIEGFPDKPSEFILIHPIGAILVHYQGSNYSNSQSIGYINQENKKEFAITVVTRDLRSNNGAYKMLDKVRSILTGFQIPGCSKLTPTKDGFISEKAGIWQYGINFTLTTKNIEI